MTDWLLDHVLYICLRQISITAFEKYTLTLIIQSGLVTARAILSCIKEMLIVKYRVAINYRFQIKILQYSVSSVMHLYDEIRGFENCLSFSSWEIGFIMGISQNLNLQEVSRVCAKLAKSGAQLDEDCPDLVDRIEQHFFKMFLSVDHVHFYLR